MESIDAYEAKTHLSKLLESVIKRERITITKHGVEVAVLKPPTALRKTETEKIIAELRRFCH